MVKKRFCVHGYVQGVGVRYFTWKQALKIGVTGFVRNLADGSVEVVAVGSESQIDTLNAWLQHGPCTAIVNNVLVEDYLGDKEFTAFQVLH
ncbi:acylphosphatase [Aggregatibacter segnis]|uniref:acylphosphatase n=1 Tax=Aggregatibacter segnis ATCC 33393 TaxID=888057 RepID=E6KWR8_9PAST|nr:acylphosphatase [Aggregatibacter segnis]EFU67949.1 acylphosphatase [Aggregatibacter segnis ATCC 33393]QQB09662.1 acylphosphatase [Aggregatibacter segnis]SQH64579.1 Acylphosphatase [Aggregatibacter segnis ATCC 33393]